MKLFGTFFLASANAEERGACMAQVRETIEANPIINGEWDCERTGKDAVNCSAKCNSGAIYGLRRSPYISAKDCDSENKRFKTNLERSELVCDEGPEFKCEAKMNELLETATIENGLWTCEKLAGGAKYRCEGSCNSGNRFRGNGQKREIKMVNCRSNSPNTSFVGFSGEPLACRNYVDWCDELAASFEIVNGSMAKTSGGRYNAHYKTICNDGRQVNKYSCTGNSNSGFPFFKRLSGAHVNSSNTDRICATNCDESALDEMYPLGAGAWNCELNKRKTSKNCKATCENGPKRFAFDMHCNDWGWHRVEKNEDAPETCDE